MGSGSASFFSFFDFFSFFSSLVIGEAITFSADSAISIGFWLNQRVFEYIIQNEKNQIGTAHTDYIIPTENQKAAVTNTEPINEYSSVSLTNDENELLTLINDERKKNNLTPLIIDENLQNVARLKAKDLVENNYFSHTSPTYGSPFEMLKNHNITYKIASENIAGNPSLSGALDSWISSESHKNNILNNDYNYTGIAVVDSIAYGKIIVELFIGK